MATRCDYCLFGRNRSANSLRDTLREFWRELWRREPVAVRSLAHPSDMGMRAFPIFISQDSWRRPADYRLDSDLWVGLGSPNRQDLERTCWDALHAMGRSRSDFVIYDFPDAPLFPNDPRYAVLVQEFTRLQAAHEKTRTALAELAAAAPQALDSVDLTETLSAEHCPICAFLRIRDRFHGVADASGHDVV